MYFRTFSFVLSIPYNVHISRTEHNQHNKNYIIFKAVTRKRQFTSLDVCNLHCPFEYQISPPLYNIFTVDICKRSPKIIKKIYKRESNGNRKIFFNLTNFRNTQYGEWQTFSSITYTDDIKSISSRPKPNHPTYKPDGGYLRGGKPAYLPSEKIQTRGITSPTPYITQSAGQFNPFRARPRVKLAVEFNRVEQRVSRLV